jgi:MoxR-like ATPase
MERLLEHEDPVVRRVAYVWHTCLARKEDFIWPCLVGPTGAGKTSRVYQLARELGQPHREAASGPTIRRGNFSGYPRPVDGVVKFLPLEAIRRAVEEPVILFLDELDKPRKENRSVVLELLWEKRLRDQELHPETLIVGAMQEVDEAWTADTDTEAIAARLLFISVPYNWEMA